MSRARKQATAKRDLVQHFAYLAENAGNKTADRFLRHAERSFADLANHPEMGVALDLRRPGLGGMRKWHVKGFESFLIFYLPRQHGVTIVRVLHASRDWWTLLGI